MPPAPDPSEPLEAHRRLAWRFRAGLHRLTLPPEPDAPPAWNRTMSLILLLSLTLVAGLSFLDGNINAAVRDADNAVYRLMIAWTDVARSQWYLIPAGALILLAGLADWGARGSGTRRVWSNLYSQALFAFATITGALLVTNLIKLLVGRGRPLFFDEYGSLYFRPFAFSHDFTSFPSGHSTTAASVAVILMLWLPRFRILIVPAALALAASRSPAGAHYPSDIVAGLTVGLLFTLFLARWLARRSVAFRFDDGNLFPLPGFRIGQIRHSSR